MDKAGPALCGQRNGRRTSLNRRPRQGLGPQEVTFGDGEAALGTALALQVAVVVHGHEQAHQPQQGAGYPHWEAAGSDKQE